MIKWIKSIIFDEEVKNARFYTKTFIQNQEAYLTDIYF